jgi:hypothetical protein
MKLLNLTSKILAVIAIFVVPCIIIIQRYSTESTTELVETTSSIGILPTLFISAIVGVALWFTTNQLSEMIRQSKFGWLAIIFFGLTLGILLFGVWFMFNSILISVQASVDDYIEVMEFHRQTVYYMLYPIGGGIALGLLNKIGEIDIIQKFFGNLLK